MTSLDYKKLSYLDLPSLIYPCIVRFHDTSRGELIVEFSKWAYGKVISDTRGLYTNYVGHTDYWNDTPELWDLIVEEIPYDPLQNGDTEEDI